MRTEWLFVLAPLVGCVSSSVRGDLDRVQSLAHSARLAAVADVEVDPSTAADVKALLGAPVDADQAVQIALLNNRDLRAELRSIGIARGALIQAGLIPNPVFEIELLPERDTHVELRVEYDLTNLILAPLAAGAAEADLDARRLEAAAAVLDTSYRVRLAFYALQAADERLRIAQRSLDALAAARDGAQALLDAGSVPRVEALRPITAYERGRVAVARLELDVPSARERVHRLLGLSGAETAWQAVPSLPPIPTELALPRMLESRAVDASLDLSTVEARMKRSARMTAVARAKGWIPDVEVDVHALYGNPEDELADAQWRFGAGLSVALPIFDRQQGRRLAYESEFDADAERMAGVAIALRSSVREARNRVVSAHARGRHFAERILPAQRSVVDETLLQYNAMQIGVLELIDAHRTALDVELEVVDTRFEFWSARAALDALLAGRMVDSEPDTMKAPAPSANAAAGGH